MKMHDGKEMSLTSIACYVLAVIVVMVDTQQTILGVLLLLLGKEFEYYSEDVASQEYLEEFNECLQDEADGLHSGDTKSTTNTLEKHKGDKDGPK